MAGYKIEIVANFLLLGRLWHADNTAEVRKFGGTSANTVINRAINVGFSAICKQIVCRVVPSNSAS